MPRGLGFGIQGLERRKALTPRRLANHARGHGPTRTNARKDGHNAHTTARGTWTPNCSPREHASLSRALGYPAYCTFGSVQAMPAASARHYVCVPAYLRACDRAHVHVLRLAGSKLRAADSGLPVIMSRMDAHQ